MAYIITSPCIAVKDGACVDACPVDCIHPNKKDTDFVRYQQFFINPFTCIDCGACEPACPVMAIFEEGLVPESEQQSIGLNRQYFLKR